VGCLNYLTAAVAMVAMVAVASRTVAKDPIIFALSVLLISLLSVQCGKCWPVAVYIGATYLSIRAG
jgi:hypothetical protein